MSTQKIIPHLWFNHEALEAVAFYTSIFPNAKRTRLVELKDTPSGDGVHELTFELCGYTFMAINGGPYFEINPSISFFVNFHPSTAKDAKSDLRALWDRLSKGGEVLMPLQAYPFSDLYGWVRDRYGVSWQVMLNNEDDDVPPKIVPSLMFTQTVKGRAEEATDFYLSIFHDTKRHSLTRYPAGMPADKEGTIMHTTFTLEGQMFAAMDSGTPHDFMFNEALSLLVVCENQAEIDDYWDKLSAHPSAEQCGWLKDKYGVSWQIWPRRLGELMAEATPEQMARITQAFLKMKKLDIKGIEDAFHEGS